MPINTNPCGSNFGPCFDMNTSNEVILKGDGPAGVTSLQCTGDGYDTKLTNLDRESSPALATLSKGLKRTPDGKLWSPTPGMISPSQARLNGVVSNYLLPNFNTIVMANSTSYSPMTFINTSPYPMEISLDYSSYSYILLAAGSAGSVGAECNLILMKSATPTGTYGYILNSDAPFNAVRVGNANETNYFRTTHGRHWDEVIQPGEQRSYKIELRVTGDATGNTSYLISSQIHLRGKGLCLPTL